MKFTFVCLFIILSNVYLYDYLVSINEVMKYIDEVILLFFFAISIIKYSGSQKYLYKNEQIILLYYFIIITSSFVGNIYYAYQDYYAAFSDFIVFIKPIAVYFLTRIIFYNYNIVRYKSYYYYFAISCTAIIFFLLIVQFGYNIFPEGEIRLGITTQKLFFSHPSRMAFAIIFCFVLMYPHVNKRIILSLTIFLGMFTTRSKYIVFMPFALFAIYCYRYVRILSSKKIFVLFILLSPLVYYLGVNQFLYYYSSAALDSGFARAILSYYSFLIANDHFPFGSGFGTFASYFSGSYYSPLYFKYGISNVFGISPENYSFVADTYWPMIIGQFGYVGLFAFSFILFNFFNLLFNIHNNSGSQLFRYYCISCSLLLISLVIDSSSDAIFSQNRAVAAFFYIALVVNSFKFQAAEIYECQGLQKGLDHENTVR